MQPFGDIGVRAIPRSSLRRFPSATALTRSGVMVLVGAAVFAVALGRAQRRAEAVLQRQLVIEAPWGRERVLVITPRRPADRADPEVERWPILVALHGRGEAVRGRDRGFLAWSIDYRLPDAFGALRRGHLTVSDFGGLVRPARLAAIRAELARRPFAGLAVVCPYTPDLIAEPPGAPAILEYGQWIAGPMLAQVRALIPELGRTRASSGIDGVSLGGMLALEIGFRHPEAFATVGAIQPAIRGREHAIAALARSDGSQRIRLLTSDRDPFLGPTRVLSEALRNRGVRHELDVVTGPHDYAFNRGPGAIEMLLWHERVLAREPL